MIDSNRCPIDVFTVQYIKAVFFRCFWTGRSESLRIYLLKKRNRKWKSSCKIESYWINVNELVDILGSAILTPNRLSTSWIKTAQHTQDVFNVYTYGNGCFHGLLEFATGLNEKIPFSFKSLKYFQDYGEDSMGKTSVAAFFQRLGVPIAFCLVG